MRKKWKGLPRHFKVGDRVMLAPDKKICDGQSLWVTGTIMKLIGWNDHYDILWDHNGNHGTVDDRQLVSEEEGHRQISARVCAALAA